MNKDKMIFRSLPIQWLFITIMIMLTYGCSYSKHVDRMKAATASFSNQTVQVKATSYEDQFIVRCEDGSIWEVRVTVSTEFSPSVKYKNCLFDGLSSFYKVEIEKMEKMEKGGK